MVQNDEYLFSTSEKVKASILVSWKTPQADYVKLNTDGVSRGNLGLAGRGRAIRGVDGNIIVVFSPFYDGRHTNLVAELMAVLDGIKLSKGLGYCKVHIELHSTIALLVISGQIKSPWQLDRLVQQIKHELIALEYIANHVYREGKKLSHLLANIGCDEHCNSTYNASTLPRIARGILRRLLLSCKLGYEKFSMQSATFSDDQISTVVVFKGKIYVLLKPSYKTETIEFAADSTVQVQSLIKDGLPCVISRLSQHSIERSEDYLVEYFGELLCAGPPNVSTTSQTLSANNATTNKTLTSPMDENLAAIDAATNNGSTTNEILKAPNAENLVPNATPTVLNDETLAVPKIVASAVLVIPQILASEPLQPASFYNVENQAA
ncbi:hypothetical protein ACH5RR_026525 [Cinchona calisaya]|uniref:RNase H type-1 domain-containing protein n=1 Tax=Cinchona calisaya TaxID=153742 RepID=A0ABD2Z2T2_9GENT